MTTTMMRMMMAMMLLMLLTKNIMFMPWIVLLIVADIEVLVAVAAL